MKKSRNKKTKKRMSLIFGIIFILLLLIFIIIYSEKGNKLDIKLKEKLIVEINEKVKISDFITEINTGEMISEDLVIDTSKPGKQKITIHIKHQEKVHNYSFDIEIVDTKGPTILAKEEVSIYVGNEVDLLKDVKVTDNSKSEANKIIVEGSYDFNKAGIYNLKYVATDLSGNKTTKEFSLKVIEDANNKVLTTSKGYTLKISNGVTYIDGILIANKSYSLPSTYGDGLTKETINAFNSMQADAASIGLNLYNSSGYRSYYDQQYIYNNYVKRDGQVAADRYSARAGHSEHQTGLAFDLNTIDWSFEYTAEGIWVNQNCYKYGLIIRYPKEKENITGYMYEPWHLRYVGVDLATKLYNNGNWITLEEYFGIDSKY